MSGTPRFALASTVLGAPDADAEAVGTVLADFPPQDDVRVRLDPAPAVRSASPLTDGR